MTKSESIQIEEMKKDEEDKKKNNRSNKRDMSFKKVIKRMTSDRIE